MMSAISADECKAVASVLAEIVFDKGNRIANKWMHLMAFPLRSIAASDPVVGTSDKR